MDSEGAEDAPQFVLTYRVRGTALSELECSLSDVCVNVAFVAFRRLGEFVAYDVDAYNDAFIAEAAGGRTDSNAALDAGASATPTPTASEQEPTSFKCYVNVVRPQIVFFGEWTRVHRSR